VYTNRTHANISKWYPEVLHFCPTTPLMLLGLKSDLRNKKNCIELLKTQGLTPVTPDQGRAVAKKMGALYMECSSKEQDGVEEIFDLAVTMAVGDEYKTPEQKSTQPSQRGNQEALAMAGGKKKKRSGCKVL
jgi:Ras family protein A